mmetsp:Transcript_23550/g.73908  ORF Transcript_23550/g.73908 Transcript_23550/m.73908 type:complete len:202 (-) Transcript_23550:379-984(-)
MRFFFAVAAGSHVCTMSVTVAMMKPKAVAPRSCVMSAKTRSFTVVPKMSPYPTAIMVAIVKYIDVTYCDSGVSPPHDTQSWSSSSSTVWSPALLHSFTKNQAHAMRCATKTMRARSWKSFTSDGFTVSRSRPCEIFFSLKSRASLKRRMSRSVRTSLIERMLLLSPPPTRSIGMTMSKGSVDARSIQNQPWKYSLAMVQRL